MASEANVLINVEFGYEDKVFEKVKAFEGVKEAYQVCSQHCYGMVARISAETREALTEKIRDGIRKIEGVRSILTC